jgi:hypothetical protein
MAVVSFEPVITRFAGFPCAEKASKNPRKPRFGEDEFRNRQGEPKNP